MRLMADPGGIGDNSKSKETLRGGAKHRSFGKKTKKHIAPFLADFSLSTGPNIVRETTLRKETAVPNLVVPRPNLA